MQLHPFEHLTDNSVRLALESVRDLSPREKMRVLNVCSSLLTAVQIAHETGAQLPPVADATVADAMEELLDIEDGDFMSAAAVARSAITEILKITETTGAPA